MHIVIRSTELNGATTVSLDLATSKTLFGISEMSLAINLAHFWLKKKYFALRRAVYCSMNLQTSCLLWLRLSCMKKMVKRNHTK